MLVVIGSRLLWYSIGMCEPACSNPFVAVKLLKLVVQFGLVISHQTLLTHALFSGITCNLAPINYDFALGYCGQQVLMGWYFLCMVLTSLSSFWLNQILLYFSLYGNLFWLYSRFCIP